MNALTVLALAASLMAAGCLGPSDETVPDGDDESPEPTTDDGAPDPDDGDDGNATPPPPPPPGNSSQPPPPPSEPREVPQKPWPSLGSATVRPGVGVQAGDSGCTSNFVFRSPDNTTLYLGIAAHCVANGQQTDTNGCEDVVQPSEVGATVRITGASKPGILVYTSWGTMQAVAESDAAACAFNDFALVAIDPADRDKVHPAMLHFGGPTALGDSSGVGLMDKVLTYGNSDLRFGIEESNWHEGYVWDKPNAWTTAVYTVAPGVPGDSGSGVLLGDGAALGVLVTQHLTPDPGANGITSLDKALEYARLHGVDVRLATWDLIDPGLLP